MKTPREYDALRMISFDGLSRADAMQRFSDAIWDAHSSHGVSWAGFYFSPGQMTNDGQTAGPDEMLLGPRRDKPACSPIGLHGVGGRAFRTKTTIVVRDVRTLGDDYVACDPRDLSELVIPLLDEQGVCFGVFDLDIVGIRQAMPCDYVSKKMP